MTEFLRVGLTPAQNRAFLSTRDSPSAGRCRRNLPLAANKLALRRANCPPSFVYPPLGVTEAFVTLGTESGGSARGWESPTRPTALRSSFFFEFPAIPGEHAPPNCDGPCWLDTGGLATFPVPEGGVSSASSPELPVELLLSELASSALRACDSAGVVGAALWPSVDAAERTMFPCPLISPGEVDGTFALTPCSIACVAAATEICDPSDGPQDNHVVLATSSLFRRLLASRARRITVNERRQLEIFNIKETK